MRSQTGPCKLRASSSTPTQGVSWCPSSSPLELPADDMGLCSSCCPSVLLHCRSSGQRELCVTAVTFAILLFSVLLQILQVILNPGVTGIGTDLAPFLCDEYDGWQGASGAGAVITQDEPLREFVVCVREAADSEVGSSWKRQGETMQACAGLCVGRSQPISSGSHAGGEGSEE